MRQGWETKTLGEVCEKASSNVSQNQLTNEAGDYPIYGASGFIKKVSFYHQNKNYISIVKDGAGIGRLALQPAYSSIIGTLQYLIPKENLDIRFFYYFLSSIDFWKYKSGSTIPHIYFKDYAVEPILVPPLPEQKRIVGILDKAFAAISTAKANSEKNLQNARDLFESYLQGVFANLGDGLEINRLEDCCDLIVDCEHKTAPICEGVNTGYYSIRTPNIGKGKLLFENANQVIEETYRLWTRRAIPEAGDLIFAREAPAGNVAMIPAGIKVCLGQRTVLIRTSKNKLNGQFLVWLILAPRIQEILLHHSRGATVAHVNMKDIRNLSLNSLPPIKEQCRIVNRLDRLSAETKKLELLYQQKIADFEELKKSVLQKAFNGEMPEVKI